MDWLLDRRYAPITNSAGVLQLRAEVVAEEYRTWQSGLSTGYSFSLRAVESDLQGVLSVLAPLSTFPRRVLFIPTRSGSTVLFDNFINGSDVAGKVTVISRRLAARGARITAIPHTISPSNPLGSYGATVLEVFQGGDTERSIWTANDGGKWTSGTSGNPYDFEDLSVYESRSVRDRFTPGLLREYLRQLEWDVFCKDFYGCGPARPAYLVEKEGPAPRHARDFCLADVQSGVHRHRK